MSVTDSEHIRPRITTERERTAANEAICPRYEFSLDLVVVDFEDIPMYASIVFTSDNIPVVLLL